MSTESRRKKYRREKIKKKKQTLQSIISHDAKHSHPLQSPRTPDTKTISVLPPEHMTMILEFAGFLAFQNFLLTNKESNSLPYSRALFAKEIALHKEWAQVSESKHFVGLKSLENLPRHLITGDDEQRVNLLKYAINHELFLLLDYLRKNKVDINSPWVILDETPGIGSMVSIEETAYTPLDDILKSSPLNTKTLTQLIDLGFQISSADVEFNILPGALEILKAKESPEDATEAAGKLLIFAYKNKLLSAKDFEDHIIPSALKVLNAKKSTKDETAGKLLMFAFKNRMLTPKNELDVLKVSAKINDPAIKLMEAWFLWKQCEDFDIEITTYLRKHLVPFIKPILPSLVIAGQPVTVNIDVNQFEAFKKKLYDDAKSLTKEEGTDNLLTNLQKWQKQGFISLPSASEPQRCTSYLYTTAITLITPLTFFATFLTSCKNKKPRLGSEAESKHSVSDTNLRSLSS